VQINEQLHLTLTVDRVDGSTVYVHAMPISREIFDRYFLVLGKVFSRMYAEGLGIVAGPRLAALLLRQLAQELGQWDGPAGVERGLMGEIRRLANVVAPSANGVAGWQIYTYDDARRLGVIDEDDGAEVDSLLVFFTVVWRLHRRQERLTVLAGGASLWGAQTSSLSLSGFVDSLPTSTVTANTGATPPAVSSPPSSTGQEAQDSRPVSGNGQTNFPGAPLSNSASAI
jgi:hypothetical protein